MAMTEIERALIASDLNAAALRVARVMMERGKVTRHELTKLLPGMPRSTLYRAIEECIEKGMVRELYEPYRYSRRKNLQFQVDHTDWQGVNKSTFYALNSA